MVDPTVLHAQEVYSNGTRRRDIWTHNSVQGMSNFSSIRRRFVLLFLAAFVEGHLCSLILAILGCVQPGVFCKASRYSFCLFHGSIDFKHPFVLVLEYSLIEVSLKVVVSLGFSRPNCIQRYCLCCLEMPTERGSFAKLMYKDHSVVVVKSLTEVATKLNLLDILVKVKDEGRHPVLEHAGSMLKLGIFGTEYEESEKELREGLKKFQKDERQGISYLQCTIITCIRDLEVDIKFN